MQWPLHMQRRAAASLQCAASSGASVEIDRIDQIMLGIAAVGERWDSARHASAPRANARRANAFMALAA